MSDAAALLLLPALVSQKPARSSRLPTTARRAARVPAAPTKDAAVPLHVLVADADDDSRLARSHELGEAGVRVSLARTGFEAIVKASCHMPDLIVLDRSLGEEEVSETRRLLTTCPVTAHIPVLAPARGRRILQRLLSSLRRRAIA